MAKRKRRKAGHKSGARNTNSSMPGWLYMLVGLAIGLTVAYAVYVNDRKQLMDAPPAAPVEQRSEPASAAPEEIEEVEELPEAGVTFDFYDMLPNLDVEVYEEERKPAITRSQPPTAPTAPTAPVTRQGIYILQAGSFSRLEDANRRKAELALLGVRSDIMKGTANDRTVYRVYTEPMEQPEDVNRTSNLLTSAGIEVMRKRVSD